MEKKITQRDYYNMIIALATKNDRDDLVKFCNERIAQLDKKSASKKPTKTQQENESIKEIVLGVLEETKSAMTVTEIMNKRDDLKALSNQKVSAIVKLLMKDGKVTKSIGEKGKSVFSAI